MVSREWFLALETWMAETGRVKFLRISLNLRLQWGTHVEAYCWMTVRSDILLVCLLCSVSLCDEWCGAERLVRVGFLDSRGGLLDC